MKKIAVVNLYQVVRMSHWEPSRFIPDDFDTLRRQMEMYGRMGFPCTYALKYDAVMDDRYRTLLRQNLGERDSLGAWWEISRPLCARAEVTFRGDKGGDRYDDRVDSAYSVGYTPEERKRLLDAYVEDFREVFGSLPTSIGSWILDPVTLEYASSRYGVQAAAICRDQIGVDGFSLWGGYPNGVYYPSRKNEYLPAQTEKNQLDIPVFRLLGPDPIYNFEAEVREGLQGVYTLEPAWIVGRDQNWLRWYFESLWKEDALGIGYAQIGQENNFLWPGIRPGLVPQLSLIRELSREGKIQVETMEETAERFRKTCRLTPPMTFQASRSWKDDGLSAQWYACPNYRVGFLWEKGNLRIRDLFLYRQAYPSRYLDTPLDGSASMADGLPVVFPQLWGDPRPFLKMADAQGIEPVGTAEYISLDEVTAQCRLSSGETFTMTPEGIRFRGNCRLCLDRLPVFTGASDGEITMEHQGFSYGFQVTKGSILRAGKDGVVIAPENGEIFLKLGENLGDIFRRSEPYCPPTAKLPENVRSFPPEMPDLVPGDSVFPWGTEQKIEIHGGEPGEIRYTLDGSEPDITSPRYSGPIPISGNTSLRARVFRRDGTAGETVQGEYRFSLKDIEISGDTVLDSRPIFSGAGVTDLLQISRGTLDYLDGMWRGTTGTWVLDCRLRERCKISRVGMGFLSHHRSGVVYPRAMALYLGDSPETLSLFREIEIPTEPGKREIEKRDFWLEVHESAAMLRLVVEPWERMPQWCFYRGAETVFTMADNLMVVPE